MLLGYLHTLMSEEDGYLLERYAGEKAFHSKGISKHVWVATLGSSVLMMDVRQLKHSPQAALPIAYR